MDLPTLFENARQRTAEAFGEVLVDRQERLWEEMRHERLSTERCRFVKVGGWPGRRLTAQVLSSGGLPRIAVVGRARDLCAF